MSETAEAQNLLIDFRNRCARIALVCIVVIALLGQGLAIRELGVTGVPIWKLSLGLGIVGYALAALVLGKGSWIFERSACVLCVIFVALCWVEHLTVSPSYAYLYTPAVMLFIAVHGNKDDQERRMLLYAIVLVSMILALLIAPMAPSSTIVRIIVISVVTGGLAETLLNNYFAVLEALEIKNQRQRELFAIVGHELRTPTAAIVMTAQDESQDERIRLKQIQDTASDLLGVMEDMRLVVAPNRAVEIADTIERPVNVLMRALDQLRPMAHEEGIELTLKTHPPEAEDLSFCFSAQALRQLAVNAIKNAIVHSGGSRIGVTLTLGPSDEPHHVMASLTVEDDGRGLGPNSKALFKPFHRGDGQQSGSGLGLFIMQQLTDRLGGTLGYTDAPLGGARFNVQFPLSVAKNSSLEASNSQAQLAPAASSPERCNQKPGGQAMEGASPLSNKRILLAEDDRLLGELTQKLLQAKGATVHWAENGRDALEWVKSRRPDLLLTDYFMPEMNGCELLAALKDEGYAIPSIALTAAVVGAERSELLVAGADDVISKPLNVAELEVIVSNLWQAHPSDTVQKSGNHISFSEDGDSTHSPSAKDRVSGLARGASSKAG